MSCSEIKFIKIWNLFENGCDQINKSINHHEKRVTQIIAYKAFDVNGNV